MNKTIYDNYVIYNICVFSHKRKIVRKLRNRYILFYIYSNVCLYVIMCVCVFFSQWLIYTQYINMSIKFSEESKTLNADHEHKSHISRSLPSYLSC